jgi:hypothetical protein
MGYREEVFKLIQQARDLLVPQKDLAELRREAVASLGDFVGLMPRTFNNFPTNSTIQAADLDPSGKWAAFALASGTILLCEMPSGKEIARLAGTNDPARVPKVWHTPLCLDSRDRRELGANREQFVARSRRPLQLDGGDVCAHAQFNFTLTRTGGQPGLEAPALGFEDARFCSRNWLDQRPQRNAQSRRLTSRHANG